MTKVSTAGWWDKLFSLPNPSIRSYFRRVVMGSDVEIRTPFFEGKSLHTIVNDWLKYLGPGIHTTFPTLLDFEMEMAEKVGPLSIMKPLTKRLPDVTNYYEDILLPQTPIDERAVEAVVNRWGQAANLSLRAQGDTLEKMKLSTNSGSPFFTRRSTVIDDTVPCSVRISGRKVIQNLNGKEWEACAVLGWRGQEGGPDPDDVKQRVVWMFPLAVNICELQFYQPAIEYAQTHGLVPAWINLDAVDSRITELFNSKAAHDLVVCTDFSKFDQHFNNVMQSCAHDIIAGISDGSPTMEQWLNDVYPVKYMIPIALNWKLIWYGMHGMGSGSGGTNFDETLAHSALQVEAAMIDNAELNPGSMCLGDDGLLSYPGISIDSVVRTYTKHGLEMNTSKQYSSTEDCVYLRRWHSTQYTIKDKMVGVYSTCRALGRLCEQERYYTNWSKEMVALRQLSILENIKFHPMREEFVEYCMKGDKYRLGIDIPGFLDNVSTIAEKATAALPDFLGYTRSLESSDSADAGIKDWWITQYLMSKK